MTVARDAVAAQLAPVRRNLLETALLVGAMVLVGATIGFTLRVAHATGRPRDLTFAGTTDEMAAWLRANGADAVGRVETARIRLGHDVVVVDTIALAADTIAEPGMATGGFVRDQIAAYNDYAIRRAVLAHHQGAAWRATGPAPSLLRTVVAEGGRRRLNDAPDASAIAIRSPHAEGAWRAVRTADWRTGPSMLGLRGRVPLTAALTPDSRSAINGRDCALHREAARFLIYCTSALAASTGKFYDFGFDARPDSTIYGFRFRPGPVWRNAARETFGRRGLAAGDLLEPTQLGPFMLSVTDDGTLAAAQWINGRTRFTRTSVGTLSFFGAAGRSSLDHPLEPLVLSFDAAFTADLEQAASTFMAARGDEIARMTIAVLDLRTGEVKAIAEPGRMSDDEPLLSFEPILIGSAVKPLIASAILAAHPELATLRVPYAGATVAQVAGVPLRVPFENEPNGCAITEGGDIDFDAYLRCSSNEYAAELLVRSLERDGYRPSAGPIVPRAILEGSTVASGLAAAFDVDAFAGRTRGRLPSYWTGSASGDSATITNNRSLIPWESRPWIVFPDSTGTRVDWLARYALGGWENRWTLLGVAQSYARIASGRAVQATFVHHVILRERSERRTCCSPDSLPKSVTTAFARVREALKEVPIDGTASGLAQHLGAAADQPVTILAKTGTLNDRAGAGHFKVLAIAMGAADTSAPRAALSCGLVMVSYFEFSDDWAAQQGDRALPPVHVEFATGPLETVVARHWRRLAPCPAPPTPTTPRREHR